MLVEDSFKMNPLITNLPYDNKLNKHFWKMQSSKKSKTYVYAICDLFKNILKQKHLKGSLGKVI